MLANALIKLSEKMHAISNYLLKSHAKLHMYLNRCIENCTNAACRITVFLGMLLMPIRMQNTHMCYSNQASLALYHRISVIAKYHSHFNN